MEIIFVMVSFLASVIGAICGIGGGIIIKPVLDACGLYSVSTISFMSGCVVLGMTTYSVFKSKLSGESLIRGRISTFLGLGAAIGGLLGKQLFDMIRNMFTSTDRVGAVQAVFLFLITLGTAVYSLCRGKISPKEVSSPAACIGIGLLLGLLSAFLGIGGGPMNLVVLYYFFSMETKTAAQNSLYIIFFSQIASLLFTLIRGNVPKLPVRLLFLMISAGVVGGEAGRRINRKIAPDFVDKLFLGLLAVIMFICCYNFWRLA